jgi:hypothetical protein
VPGDGDLEKDTFAMLEQDEEAEEEKKKKTLVEEEEEGSKDEPSKEIIKDNDVPIHGKSSVIKCTLKNFHFFFSPIRCSCGCISLFQVGFGSVGEERRNVPHI